MIAAGDLVMVRGWDGADIIGIVRSIELYAGNQKPKFYYVDTWEFDENNRLEAIYKDEPFDAKMVRPLSSYWQQLQDRQNAVTAFMEGKR